ncbi:MAG: N-acetylmuramoyl-L-alanine amidase [Clostridia bacterium]|nr:N-acetylmuramoyl-L-alanine amidase [Clostridia bacterium]
MQRGKKSVIAALLAAILIIVIPAQAFGLEFNDVPITASYYKAVDKLSNVGVIQGRGDGAFAPGDNTTRAEFCAFLARANGYNPNYYQPKELPFPDINEEHWAYPYISFCYENGYINGMLDGTFCPNDYVTDEQAVKMVVCSSGVGDESLSKVGPKWYSGYLNVAEKYSLLNGTRVNISSSANRAFVAQVVYNATLVGGNDAQDAVIVGNTSNKKPGVLPGTPEKNKLPGTPAEDEEDDEAETAKKPVITEEDLDEPFDATEEEKNKEKEKENEKKPVRKPVSKDGKILIVLDAGHNYSITDTGAVGNGIREQDITFYIAEKAKTLLERNGFKVIMTRENLKDNVSTESVMASLTERAAIANESKADLFLSIHCNAGGGTGTETYYSEDSDFGEELAELIQENVVDMVGLADRGVKSAGFVVLETTEMVAALLETGFIDNEDDAEVLKSEAYQWDFAEGIARAICEYFGKKYN